jgi:hypothetical protein
MTDPEIQTLLERLRTRESLHWRSPHTGEIHKIVGYKAAHKEFDGDIPEPVVQLEHNKVASLWESQLKDFVTVHPAFAQTPLLEPVSLTS